MASLAPHFASLLVLLPLSLVACGGKTEDAEPGDALVDAGGSDGSPIRDVAPEDVRPEPIPDSTLPDVPLPSGGALPPPRPPTAATGGATQWFVVNRLRLGFSTVGGPVSASAWKDYGFDLDGRTTSLDQSKASTGSAIDPGVSCHRVPGSPSGTLVDGNEGRDNNFGGHVLQTVKSLKSDSEDAVNAGIAGGQGTLLLRLDNVTGSDNSNVPGTLYLTAPSAPPRFDGTDALPVASSSVSGGLDKPLYRYTAGYMSGGFWVSGEVWGAPIVVPLGLAGAPLSLDAGGVVMVRVADGSAGMIAGASRAATMIDYLTPLMRSFGICPGNATYDQVVTTVTQSADLVAARPLLQDPTVTCDSISVGLGFTMVRAQPPTTVAPAPTPADPCK